MLCLVASCGGGGDNTDTGNTVIPIVSAPAPPPPAPAPPPTLPVTAMVNSADPRLAVITDTDGTSYAVSGARTAQGLPVAATDIQSSGSGVPVELLFDAQQRLSGMYLDGASFRLTYTTGKAAMESTDSDGSTIDTFVAVGTATSGVTGESAGVSPLALPPRTADISVRRCGSPRDGDVLLDIVSATNGVVARSIPAQRIGEGRYQASIPQSETSLNLDFHAHDAAQALVTALRSVCNGDRDNLGTLKLQCAALAGLAVIPEMKAIARVASACSKGLTVFQHYCDLSHRSDLEDSVLRATPEILTLHAAELRVRARMIAVPSSYLSASLPFDGSLGFSFLLGDDVPCPTLVLGNRDNGGQYLPAVGGGTVYSPPTTLFFSLDDRWLGGVEPGQQKTVRLPDARPGQILRMFGTSYFIRDIYNPMGTYNGWCPRVTISPAPWRMRTIEAYPPNTTTTSLYTGGNPICWASNFGLVNLVALQIN
jgi:hypothetical protein